MALAVQMANKSHIQLSYVTYPVVLSRILLFLVPGTSQPPVLQDLQGFGFS